MKDLFWYVGVVALLAVAVVFSQKSHADELYIHTISEHYVNDSDSLNEENWGVSYVYEEHNVGIALNSYSNVGGYYAYNFYSRDYGLVDVGLGAGIALGYDRYPVLPFIAATVDIGRVRGYVAPGVVNLAFRVAEW